MGFLKALGTLAGQVAGDVVGGSIKFVGDITGSEFIDDIGEGVQKASYFAGDKLGEVASGTWDVAAGIITQDEWQLDEGLDDMGKAIGDTAKAAGHAVCNIVDNGRDVVGGVIDGDNDRILDGTKGLVKFGVVGALSFGLVDLVDGDDGSTSGQTGEASSETTSNFASSNVVENSSSASTDYTVTENPNTHHVEPYERTYADGTTVWVDGDGDTSVDTYDGWVQSNPDYRVKA